MPDAGWCSVVGVAVDGSAGAGVVVSGCFVGRTSLFELVHVWHLDVSVAVMI